MIAAHAEPILSARLRGLKPDEMVMVSLIGKIRSENLTVYAQLGQQYDWRWVRGLDICLYIDEDLRWAEILKHIALQRPDYLCIWHQAQGWGAKVYLIPTAEDVSKPVRQWTYELDFLPWLDIENKDFER